MIRVLPLLLLLTGLATGARAQDLHLTTADLDAVLQEEVDESPTLPELDESGTAPRRWWPILASAVVPGLGELSTGYMRGIPMIAVDAAIWTGVVINQNEGNDKEKEFEAFADQHWSEEKWREAVEQAEGSGYPPNDNFGAWYPQYRGKSADEIPLYVSREEDEREWYENAGKWNEFAWGWREYWDPDWNFENNFDRIGRDYYLPQPGLPDTWFYGDNATMTPLRKQYIEIREESNSAFETRDTLLSAALLLRVVSVLQVVYLEGFIGRRYDSPDESQLSLATPQGSWRATANATGSGMVAWRMTW
jgi:hypothetical protein